VDSPSPSPKIDRPSHTRWGDSWVDNIELDMSRPDSRMTSFYGRPVPSLVLVLAIVSGTSPISILKQAQEIKKALLKEGT
jgi:hypothetical protein